MSRDPYADWPRRDRLWAAKFRRKDVRDLLAQLNQLDPCRRFILLEDTTMSATADVKTITDYITALQGELTTAQAAQLTPDDAAALATIASTAAAITAANPVVAAPPAETVTTVAVPAA